MFLGETHWALWTSNDLINPAHLHWYKTIKATPQHYTVYKLSLGRGVMVAWRVTHSTYDRSLYHL